MIKYTPGDFYTWHSDFNAGSSSTRKLVTIVQLTDPSEYEGGETQLAKQDPKTMEYYTMPQEKGTLVNFSPCKCFINNSVLSSRLGFGKESLLFLYSCNDFIFCLNNFGKYNLNINSCLISDISLFITSEGKQYIIFFTLPNFNNK